MLQAPSIASSTGIYRGPNSGTIEGTDIAQDQDTQTPQNTGQTPRAVTPISPSLFASSNIPAPDGNQGGDGNGGGIREAARPVADPDNSSTNSEPDPGWKDPRAWKHNYKNKVNAELVKG